MANVQKEFEKFIDTIKLGTMDEEQILRTCFKRQLSA